MRKGEGSSPLANLEDSMHDATDRLMAELGDEKRLTIDEYLRVTGLINKVLTTVYNNDDSPFARGANGVEDWLNFLPESLVRLLLELLVPIADHPHRCYELDATLDVLNALGHELTGR